MESPRWQRSCQRLHTDLDAPALSPEVKEPDALDSRNSRASVAGDGDGPHHT